MIEVESQAETGPIPLEIPGAPEEGAPEEGAPADIGGHDDASSHSQVCPQCGATDCNHAVAFGRELDPAQAIDHPVHPVDANIATAREMHFALGHELQAVGAWLHATTVNVFDDVAHAIEHIVGE